MLSVIRKTPFKTQFKISPKIHKRTIFEKIHTVIPEITVSLPPTQQLVIYTGLGIFAWEHVARINKIECRPTQLTIKLCERLWNLTHIVAKLMGLMGNVFNVFRPSNLVITFAELIMTVCMVVLQPVAWTGRILMGFTESVMGRKLDGFELVGLFVFTVVASFVGLCAWSLYLMFRVDKVDTDKE